jgi:predicted nucleotidyltransferase component of viral defense system
MVRPTVLKNISHPYSDGLPQPAQIRCYSFEEIFAEKLRAMSQRGRPRDLYDIALLFKHKDNNRLNSQQIKTILEKKCAIKNIPIPTLESIQNATTKPELISEWENMLGYQVHELQQFEYFWAELPHLFKWLESG